MTFLPIAQRELRAASRRKSTHRIRCCTALLAMGASLVSLVATPAIAGAYQPLFVETRAWASGLPQPVTEFCDTWARRLRSYPLAVSESYTYDAATDTTRVKFAGTLH